MIEQLAEQTADVPVCVVLTDDRARLLVRLDTTASIGRAADDNHFAEGFSYGEGAVGTNGVGTVLETGGSVHVVGAEHFVEPLQPYACAGAPVRDPFTGRIEGTVPRRPRLWGWPARRSTARSRSTASPPESPPQSCLGHDERRRGSYR
ncbi:MAG: hypothetical protein L0I76_12750 [Pseudonocardia sp.]|nr:hypothetical protein [Pseudonocardia sp.]